MNISSAELKKRLSANSVVKIIDVREELEFHTYNIGGENIPLGKLPAKIEDLEYGKTDEIVVLCQHGIRSETAVRLLILAGFTNVRNLAGGLKHFIRH